MKKNNVKKIFKIYVMSLIFIGFMPTVLAADDPITVVNNLSDFIFSFTKVIGGIIVGYGIIQFGLSFTTHDASQKVNGVLFIAGGIIIVFAKPILNTIAG